VIGLFSAWFAQHIAPNANMQLVLGNYTNVTSALGAAIAAGASTATHASLKKLHNKHDDLKKSVDNLHIKIDKLTVDNSTHADENSRK
jgi:glycerol kinase